MFRSSQWQRSSNQWSVMHQAIAERVWHQLLCNGSAENPFIRGYRRIAVHILVDWFTSRIRPSLLDYSIHVGRRSWQDRRGSMAGCSELGLGSGSRDVHRVGVFYFSLPSVWPLLLSHPSTTQALLQSARFVHPYMSCFCPL